MLRFSGIKAAAGPARPSPETCMNPVATCQRAGLFNDECKQNGKKAHAKS
jgi:hypothetical protein